MLSLFLRVMRAAASGLYMCVLWGLKLQPVPKVDVGLFKVRRWDEMHTVTGQDRRAREQGAQGQGTVLPRGAPTCWERWV